MRKIVAPSTLRKYERALSAQREAYRAIRSAALAVAARHRREQTGRSQLAREDATAAAVAARAELRAAAHWISQLEVVAGGRLSPRELARRRGATS